ncbi:hypothetical protein BC834DRAFT_252059 [Gloeopeniophorella convolvens]|nr:hypothetical protein BC834DRAFT_252059 [Gloeopeniophorella convolvens]
MTTPMQGRRRLLRRVGSKVKGRDGTGARCGSSGDEALRLSCRAIIRERTSSKAVLRYGRPCTLCRIGAYSRRSGIGGIDLINHSISLEVGASGVGAYEYGVRKRDRMSGAGCGGVLTSEKAKSSLRGKGGLLHQVLQVLGQTVLGASTSVH